MEGYRIDNQTQAGDAKDGLHPNVDSWTNRQTTLTDSLPRVISTELATIPLNLRKERKSRAEVEPQWDTDSCQKAVLTLRLGGFLESYATHRSVCRLPAPEAWFTSPSSFCSSRSLTLRSTNHRPDGCLAGPSLSPSTGPASLVVFLFLVLDPLGESLRFLLLLVPFSQSCLVCHHQNVF